MTITITIDTDNAAFEDNEGAETARILRQLADQIEARPGCYGYNLHDFNGNKVGTCTAE